MKLSVPTVVVLLLSLLNGCGQTNSFSSPGAWTMTRFVGLSRLELDHNSPEVITGEVFESTFAELLKRVAKIPATSSVQYEVIDADAIKVSNAGITKEQAEAVATSLVKYITQRFDGHTAKYSRDSMGQALDTSSETNFLRAVLFRKFPDLPHGWVQDAPVQPIGTSTNWLVPHVFVVIDGDIAWGYSVSPNGVAAFDGKDDAVDFDLKLKPILDGARAEAEKNLRDKGVQKGLGYIGHFEAEVNSILWDKHTIKRRGFSELNRNRGIYE